MDLPRCDICWQQGQRAIQTSVKYSVPGPVYFTASSYDMSMTKDAEQLMSAALKAVKLSGSFSPTALGAKIGLDKFKAEAAARWLSNAGVLELSFDNAAQFTRDFRNAQPASRIRSSKKARR